MKKFVVVCALLITAALLLCACSSGTPATSTPAGSGVATQAAATTTTTTQAATPMATGTQAPAATGAEVTSTDGKTAVSLEPGTEVSILDEDGKPITTTVPESGVLEIDSTPLPTMPAETLIDDALIGTWRADLSEDSWISWAFSAQGDMILSQQQMGVSFSPEEYTYTTKDGQIFMANADGDAATRWYEISGNTLTLYLQSGGEPEFTLTKQ